MDHLITSLVVLLCAAQTVLGQEFDCSTTSGQLGFLRKGAESDPECYNPVINLLTSETPPTPTISQIENVCRDACAGLMLGFLRSTDKCRNDEDVKIKAYFLENELCAYKEGEGRPETSCALKNESGIRVTVACLGWWLFGGSQCPALVDGVPVDALSCADALRTVVEEYGCCLENIFHTEDFIEEATEYVEEMIPQGTNVPSDFEVDVTDRELYAACNVSPTKMCQSQITSTTDSDPTKPTTTVGNAASDRNTVTSATTATSASAPSVMATPLTALLLAIMVKLSAYYNSY